MPRSPASSPRRPGGRTPPGTRATAFPVRGAPGSGTDRPAGMPGRAAPALAWKPVHGRRVHYDLFRNGHRIGRVKHAQFKDHKVKPSATYHYAVAVRLGHLESHRSRKLTVHTPARVQATPAPPPPAPQPPP